MKKILLPLVLLAITGLTPLFALDVTFTPPRFGGSFPGVNEINRLIETVFAQYEREINSDLQDITINPAKLGNAFATASIFSSTGATQRGYGAYDKFAVTLGAMGGIMNPENLISFAREMNNTSLDNLEELDNMDMGFNPQVLSAQLGFNASFLVKRLYLGLKLGYFRFDNGSIAFTTPSIGMTANYQLIPEIKLPLGILVWRGINLGTGLIYQHTDMSFRYPLDSRREPLNVLGYTVATMNIDSKLTLGFEKNTFTVPLEAVTSLRLLGINLSLGLGADLGFGSADLKITGDVAVTFEDLPDILTPTQNAGLSASTGGTNSPDLFNPKLMAGLGFSFGPVILDIPFTYYFLSNGYNLGITLGFIL